MNLEQIICWPEVLAQPREAGGHEDVLRNIFGGAAKVIAWWQADGYGGEVAIAFEFANGEVAVMTDYYGSCPACDAWAGCSDNEAYSLIVGLVCGAKQFPTARDAAQWAKSIDEREKPWEFPWRSAHNLVEQLESGGAA